MSKKNASTVELRLRTPEQARAALAAMSQDERSQVSPAWRAKLEASQHSDPWLHGFTAIAGDGSSVGEGAFKGPPIDGVVEIAYRVDADRQGLGYATSIAMGLTAFALAEPGVVAVRAHTLTGGVASQRVLEKCGFTRLGEVVDPEDGVVVRFEKRSP